MRFHIENMTCDGCVRGVTMAILSVDPEAKVEADPASRKVTVRSGQPGGPFLSALGAAGFAATAQLAEDS